MRYIFLTIFLYTSLTAASKLFCVGSTTIQPIIEQVVNKYKQERGVELDVQGGGSLLGIEALKESKTDIAMVSRGLSQNEKEKFSHVTIGYDSLAIIVNTQNPLQDISTTNLIKIYKSSVINWKELNKNDEEIVVISKKVDRGTMKVFEKYTKLFHPQNQLNSDDSKRITDNAWQAGANSDVIVWVGGIPNSIGFVSYGTAISFIKDLMPIKILNLDGVKLTFENLKNRKYPIVRPLNIVYKKENSKAKEFAWWLLSEYAQDVVKKNYFIKATE